MSDLYFAYGSNMSRTRLAARLGETRCLGRAVLAHFELAWNKPGVDGSGKANLRPRTGAETWGVLYALERGQWARLDAFEPGYARETERVRDDAGRWHEAQLYRYRPDGPDRAPSPRYLELVQSGAREHGLPERVVAALARLATAP